MNRWWPVLVLLLAIGVHAQEESRRGASVAADTAAQPDPDDPCAPLPAGLQDAAEGEKGESPEDDDGLGRIGADGLPCPPLPAPDAEDDEEFGRAPPPPEGGDGPASEEDFEPDEEISEDYPVPLPSDI